MYTPTNPFVGRAKSSYKSPFAGPKSHGHVQDFGSRRDGRSQRQSDDMDFGKIRVFSDHDTALSAAWMEDGDSDMDLPLHELAKWQEMRTMSDAICELMDLRGLV